MDKIKLSHKLIDILNKSQQENFKKNLGLGKILLEIFRFQEKIELLKDNKKEETFVSNGIITLKILKSELLEQGLDLEDLYDKYIENKDSNEKTIVELIKTSINNTIDKNKKYLKVFIDKYILGSEKITENKRETIKTLFEELLLEVEDFERIEFIENFKIYSEIKIDINEEEDLYSILNKINTKKGLENYIKDFNRFKIEPFYSNNKLNAQKGSSNDIEFFYFKNNQWFSRSGSVTKSAESYFEDVQNNTHSYKTYLKLSILNTSDFTSLKELNHKKSPHLLILNNLNNLNNDSLLLLQDCELDIKDIIPLLTYLIKYTQQIYKKDYEGNLKNLIYSLYREGKLLEYKNSNNKIDFLKNISKDRDTKNTKNLNNVINSTIKMAEYTNNSLINNKINDFQNEKNHSHDFIIHNPAVNFKEIKKYNDMVFLTILFSHINNELQSKLDLTKEFDRIVDNYYLNSGHIHNHLNISVKYVKNNEVIEKKSPKEQTSKYLKELTTNSEYFFKICNLIEETIKNIDIFNKKLKENIKLALDSIFILGFTYYKQNQIVMDKISDLKENNKHLNWRFSSEKELTILKTKKIEKDKLQEEKDKLQIEKDKLQEEKDKLIIKLGTEGKIELLVQITQIKPEKLAHFMVSKYLEGNSQNKEKIEKQIKLLKKEGFDLLPEKMEIELEKQIEELTKNILEENNIDEKEQSVLTEQIKKEVRITKNYLR